MGASITVVKQIEISDKEMLHKRGIAFYCSVRHKYITIENNRHQNLKGK